MVLIIIKMKIKKIVLLFLTIVSAGMCPIYAQKYEVNKNAHSHNDYLQPMPFYTAYANRFASMEIDVYLIGKELYVAHTRKEIDSGRTIEKLYLEPLLRQIKINRGKPYKNGGHLQFMIDLKTPGEPALKVLEAKLKPIRKYFDTKNNPNAVRLVFSGSVPSAERFKDFDEIFFFDGRPGINYTPDQLKRIAFFSSAIQQFTLWNGLDPMLPEEQARVRNFVDSVHTLKKPVRFWGNPDTKTCWETFIKLGVDYLNTDKPTEMAQFLNNL